MKTSILLLLITSLSLANASEHGAEHVVHHADKHAEPIEAKAEHEKPFMTWVKEKIMGQFEEKLKDAMNLDMDNQFLRSHIAELELENAILLYQTNSCTEKARAHEVKTQAKVEGGTESARTVASLDEKGGDFLGAPPKAVFEKASNDFAEENYESAAKGFLTLLDNHENKTYQTPETYFFAGISLYQLKNYKKSAEYLIKCKDLVTREPASSTDQISFAPRSMAWLALAYDKLGKVAESKAIVHQLIQKYPKSQEARRYSLHGK